MSSSSNPQTASDEEKDRLSNLPEFILCHILSFLLTKDAAKTSILSTRWKYLFLAVPKIDLVTLDPPTQFISQRLMLCRTPSITAFRLRCNEFLEANYLVHLWLTTLMFRNAQVLDIELVSQSSSSDIPKCSLSKHLVWESLVIMKLNGNQIVFKTSESAFFPNLKVLNLTDLEMHSLSQTYRFSDEGYPLLEDLRLEEVTLKRNQDHKPLLHVSLSTLKKLITNYLDKEVRQMDVHTPHLQYLELRMFGACPEMKINICNIVSVYLDQRDSGSQRFTDWLSKVSNVKELDVLGTAAEGFVHCVAMPQFPNLTRLNISTSAKQSVWNVLQHSPNLEILHIQSYVMENVRYLFRDCCPHPETAPPCFARTLRKIQIRSSGESELEIEALRFILQHGAVLQSLVVYSYWARGRKPWSLSTAMNLLKQKRLSPNCEVELHSW